VELTEGMVARIWGQGLVAGRLHTTTGQRLRVIHPGRANTDTGPDFKEAWLAVAGRRLRGDVEVHLRSSQWRSHGHHKDRTYNGVVLQVVWQDDIRGPTQLQDGGQAPVLALEPYLGGSVDEIWRRAAAQRRAPCGAGRGEGLGARLDQLGRKRFLAKARRFKAGLSHTRPDQVLYEGIMEALGYAKNQGPFLGLAQRLPLDRLEAASQGLGHQEAVLVVEALLLGGAGLLPSQRRTGPQGDDPFVARLEGLWRARGGDAVVEEGAWCLLRVRPENLPSRRLAAAARLLARYRGQGLLAGISQWVGEAVAKASPRALEEALRVEDQGYWANHYDFGLPARPRSPGLLGRGRAAEIAVNVILPFFWAFSGPASGIMSLYEGYPKLGDNHITRYMMARLGADGSAMGSAQRQQGLIQLYKAFCRRGGCSRCPLVRPS